MKVIYFDIDTLRMDRLSCYGASKTTPNIDALCQDGIRFNNAFASNTPCMPSRAAVFTGCFGVVNGIETHGKGALSVRTSEETALARVLSHSGVETVTISSFGRHPAPWFYNGFTHVIDPSYRCGAENFQRFQGSEVNNAAFEFLKGFHGDNLFLHLHYWDPHGPLVPPAEFIDAAYTPNTDAVSEEMLKALSCSNLYRGGKHANVKTRNDLQEIIRLYDAEIAYTDFLIGQMTDFLKSLGIYDECAIILSSDHGEQYGEAQMILEHGTVHNSCIHIPLLFKPPFARKKLQQCQSYVYGLDIAPTVAQLFGISVPVIWNGISLFRSAQNQDLRKYIVCEHGLYTCQRAIIISEWKYVHTYSAGVWDFPEHALYRISEDFFEQFNVAETYPEITKRLHSIEKEWLTTVIQDKPDLLEQIGKDNLQSGLKIAMQITRKYDAQQEERCTI
ncbi:MAG: sulfatase [Christensenella sp.]